ncbi:MAG: hypothetical protein COV44_07660 [Deltaproteobacteria bacterium CG11_big_fil_rev_8_21_14_0_20_45_16]|nr:MAG: hypothetical protein COV44_07660 [Deltaproteobacteria bacterium CG11_big_fil_rev_8_21_14_0_20_45_16]
MIRRLIVCISLFPSFTHSQEQENVAPNGLPYISNYVLEIPLDEEKKNFYRIILSEDKILSLADMIQKGQTLGQLALTSLMNPTEEDTQHTSAYYRFVADEFSQASKDFEEQSKKLQEAESALMSKIQTDNLSEDPPGSFPN